jgi:hypothetical protein
MSNEQAHSPVKDKFRCPQRNPAMDAVSNYPRTDAWKIDTPKGDRTCSYCGGIHPDDFIPILKAACDPTDLTRIDWSDKSYKIYISRPDVKNASEGAIKSYGGHGLPTGYTTEALLALLKEADTASNVKHEIVTDKLQRDLESGEFDTHSKDTTKLPRHEDLDTEPDKEDWGEEGQGSGGDNKL